MKKEDLMQAMTDIDDRFIEEAAPQNTASGNTNDTAANVNADSTSSDAQTQQPNTANTTSQIPFNRAQAPNKTDPKQKPPKKSRRVFWISGSIAAAFVAVFAITVAGRQITRRLADSSYGYGSAATAEVDGGYMTETATDDYYGDYDTGYGEDEYWDDDYWESEESVAAEESADGWSVTPSITDTDRNDTPDSSTDGAISLDKIVYSADLDIQTKDYATSKAAIQSRVSEFGGIIEYEYESNSDTYWYLDDYERNSSSNGYMSWNVTVRVPSAQFDAFVNAVGDSGEVINKSSTATNISKSYYSTAAEIEALETQANKLQDMLEQAETIEDMITVEARLSEVESQLNYAKTYLSDMDTDVAYSTVTISLEEVSVYTPEPTARELTFGEQVKEAFVDSFHYFVEGLKGILFLLIYALPVLIVIAVIVVIVILILKSRKKKKALRQNQAEQNKNGQNQ